MVFPFEQAKEVLTHHRAFVKSASVELNIWVVLRHAPPLPFLPAGMHGQKVAILAIFYVGDPADGEKLIPPLRRFGNIIGEHVGPMPYSQWQQAFDSRLQARRWRVSSNRLSHRPLLGNRSPSVEVTTIRADAVRAG